MSLNTTGTASASLSEVYPVGSLYISTSSTNPSTWFGGTWVAHSAGQTPLGYQSGTYDAGTTGGKSTHALSSTEIPSHYHTMGQTASTTAGQYAHQAVSGSYNFNGIGTNTGTAGSGSAHNNMPPYQVVYIWKRTA